MGNDAINLLLGPVGTLVLSLSIILTGVKGLWVFGWVYRDIARERDEWKDVALRGTKIAERTVTLHEKGNDGSNP